MNARSFAPNDIALAYLIAIGNSSPDISYIANEKNPFDPKRFENAEIDEDLDETKPKNKEEDKNQNQMEIAQELQTLFGNENI